MSDSREYLVASGVEVYLHDVMALLIKLKPDKPIAYMHEYFQGLRDHQNIALREYAFVNATSHNRISFLVALSKAVESIPKDARLSAKDLCQLATLLCPDIPVTLFEDLAYGMADANSSKTHDLRSLLTAFNVHFFYQEHMKHLRRMERPSDISALLSREDVMSWATSFSQNERPFCWPPAIPAAFLSRVLDAVDKQSCTSAEVIVSMLTSRDIEAHVLTQATVRWKPRDSHEAIASLFAPDEFEISAKERVLTRQKSTKKAKDKPKKRGSKSSKQQQQHHQGEGAEGGAK